LRLVGRSRDLPSFRQFYSEDLFASIARYIRRPLSSYRVASVGLHPDVAAYNGFYTVDGYQRFYSLEYKHAFRKVIAPELNRSPALRHYFDDWGNRCYVFASELPGRGYLSDSTSRPITLQIDTKVLASLGTAYLLSTVRIVNATDIGLRFERTFAGPGPRRIELYRIDTTSAAAIPARSVGQ